MKITKSTFCGAKERGNKSIFWAVEETLVEETLPGETLPILMGEIKKQCDLEYLRLFL